MKDPWNKYRTQLQQVLRPAGEMKLHTRWHFSWLEFTFYLCSFNGSRSPGSLNFWTKEHKFLNRLMPNLVAVQIKWNRRKKSTCIRASQEENTCQMWEMPARHQGVTSKKESFSQESLLVIKWLLSVLQILSSELTVASSQLLSVNGLMDVWVWPRQTAGPGAWPGSSAGSFPITQGCFRGRLCTPKWIYHKTKVTICFRL